MITNKRRKSSDKNIVNVYCFYILCQSRPNLQIIKAFESRPNKKQFMILVFHFTMLKPLYKLHGTIKLLQMFFEQTIFNSTIS